MAALLSSPFAADELCRPGGAVVVVRPGGAGPDEEARSRLASLPCIVMAADRPPGAPVPFADLVVEAPAPPLDDVLDRVAHAPNAATALTLLLRSGPPVDVGAGLVAESAVYAMLQGGPELARWLVARRAGRPPARHRAGSPGAAGPAVRVHRSGSRLEVVLDRPEVRNAFSAAMRDELVAALAVAAADPEVAEVVLRGEGPDFCSGGDLDEFGTFGDPPSAHALRLTRSAARSLHELRGRVRAEVHGHCVGAGIELPAFAARVVARPSLRAALPEVAMGLVPGAGGTVSLPARIGRQRTLLWALSGAVLDAPTALAWGLVDEVVAEG